MLSSFRSLCSNAACSYEHAHFAKCTTCSYEHAHFGLANSLSLIMDVVSEDFVRDKLVEERWTYKELSDYLQRLFPGAKGLSVRSLKRFTNIKGIKKSSALGSQDLDRVVNSAIAKVSLALIRQGSITVADPTLICPALYVHHTCMLLSEACSSLD